MSQSPSHHPITPYGAAIHQSMAGGDLQKMKLVATQTEQYLAQYGDVRPALAMLHAEIARLEAKGG